MTIAILGGTGKEGQGLARRWAAAGRKVVLGSRDAERGSASARALREALGEVDLEGADNREAARAGEIIVSTLPDKSHLQILSDLSDEVSGKLVITATIAWPPGPTSEPSAAEMLRDALPGARVVAAFQTVSAGTLAAAETPEAEDVLVFSDDDEAAAAARKLVDETGLRGVVAGKLQHARIAEAITGLLIQINRRHGVKSTGIRITGLGAL